MNNVHKWNAKMKKPIFILLALVVTACTDAASTHTAASAEHSATAASHGSAAVVDSAVAVVAVPLIVAGSAMVVSGAGIAQIDHTPVPTVTPDAPPALN